MRSTARHTHVCTHCQLPGHMASTCWISARRGYAADPIDVAISRLDLATLRDRPADLRIAIDRIVRRALDGRKQP